MQVLNINSGKTYSVDLEVGLCSCFEGAGGKFCKHLLVALQNSNVESSLMLPSTESERRKLFFIATGKQLELQDHWFQPLIHSDECK